MPRFARVILVLAFVCCTLSKRSFAQVECENATISKWSGSNAQIGKCLEVFFDPTSSLGIEEILEDYADKFAPSTSLTPNLGFKAGTFWMRFWVKQGTLDGKKLHFSLGNPLVDLAHLYQVKSSQVVHSSKAGVMVSSQDEAVKDRDVVFLIPNRGVSNSVFYISARGVQQSFVPVLRTEVDFNSHQKLEYLVFGLYFGVILVMAFYNLGLFFVVRDTVYLWYVGAIVFFHGFCFAGLLGATNHFLWPEATLWAQRQLPASAPLGLLFTVLFASKFLQIATLNRRIAEFLRILCGVLVIHFLVSLIWFDVVLVTVGFGFQICALSLVMWSALPQAWQGNRSARLFLLAWACLIVTGLLFSAAQFGILNHTFFTQNGPLFGSALEVVLLSFALGDKINTMRLEKESAQQLAIQNAREKALIDTEMAAAVAVQATLLPPQFHASGCELATYYRVAEHVGGDWFWHSQDERTGFVYVYIGDVTGHGVPSALLTGVICGAVASLESEFSKRAESIAPKERLLLTAENINEVVWKTGARSDRWVSMCLVCFDPSSGTVTSVNAGHPFPLIWHSKDAHLESIVSSGPLMGNKSGAFSVHIDALAPGDFLMLFTDGLFEARERLKSTKSLSRRRELARLFIQCDSAHDVADRISQELSVFTENENSLNDDVSVVILRRSDSATPEFPILSEEAA